MWVLGTPTKLRLYSGCSQFLHSRRPGVSSVIKKGYNKMQKFPSHGKDQVRNQTIDPDYPGYLLFAFPNVQSP